MKTYDERTEAVLKGVRRANASRRKKRIALLSGMCCFLLVLGLVLFLPLEPLSVLFSQDGNREYSAVIGALRPMMHQEKTYSNLFEKWFGDLGSTKEQSAVLGGTGMWNGSLEDVEDAVDGGMQPPPTAGDPGESSSGTYTEVTDNQVKGVIEGDLIKRSDRHIYYFANRMLGVYSIEGEASRLVGSYVFESDYGKDVQLMFGLGGEMFLSADCRTVTLITPCFRNADGKIKRQETAVIALDVSDPASISECSRIYVSGSLRSARLTNGSFLLMTDYRLYERDDIDFDRPETFIPGYTVNGEEMLVSEGQIIIPETCNKAEYSVVCMIDADTMSVTASAAVLSCTETVYVSKDKIFIAEGRSRHEEPEKNTSVVTTATEIAVLSYGEGSLSCLGSVQVDGTVNNQYAMDERDGVLRVVTSVLVNRSTETKDEKNTVTSFTTQTERFGNLVCIDLSTFAVVGQVTGFAPGETVESVRFDGDFAYVCTAEVVVFTDPVFVFDLTDLKNITWKDTGTIDGYSTSLIELPNGFLLGIGFGERAGVMKLEIYVETEHALLPIAAYEREVSTFSTEYKSYLIDRENGYFGVPYTLMDAQYTHKGRFVLVHFNGEALTPVADLEALGVVASTRAVLIDGYLYLFSNGDGHHFAVTAVKG